ncbi:MULTISPECIES: alpha/beta fold hydrolase [Amycolatopsis]|uniref:alpha/beta fold hydrolase n=1 Tax=Amycolatopsis TaxID=1813 RepID=UPI0033B33D83
MDVNQTLVLLHGGGVDSRAWARLLRRLPPKTDVLALDLAGHGAEPGFDYGPDVVSRLAGLTAVTLRDRGVETPLVLGHSLGGAVALELARLVHVSGAIALAPIGFWSPLRGRYAAAALRHASKLSRNLHIPLRDRLLAGRVTRSAALGLFSAEPSMISAEEASTMASALAVSDIAAMSRHTGRYRFRRAPEITAPVTIVWAGRDRIIGRRGARRAAELLPTATQVVIPHSGHLVPTDAPGEVARIITCHATLRPQRGDY